MLAVQTISDMSASDSSKAPALIIVDSVQTMRSGSSASAAGSVAQIRDSTAQLVQLAKLTGMFFVSHLFANCQWFNLFAYCILLVMCL